MQILASLGEGAAQKMVAAKIRFLHLRAAFCVFLMPQKFCVQYTSMQFDYTCILPHCLRLRVDEPKDLHTPL